MNKRFLVLSFTLISLISLGQTLPKNAIKSIERFKNASLEHAQEGVFQTLDKSYRKEQMKFLENRKEQFINELYAGIDVQEQWHNCRLADVQHIELIEWFEEEGGNYTIIFNMRCHEKSFIASYLFKKKGKKFGIVGAVG